MAEARHSFWRETLLQRSRRRNTGPERGTIRGASWTHRIFDADDITECQARHWVPTNAKCRQMGSYWMGSIEKNTLGAECTKASCRRAADWRRPVSRTSATAWSASGTTSKKEAVHQKRRCAQAWGNWRLPRLYLCPCKIEGQLCLIQKLVGQESLRQWRKMRLEQR